MCGIIGYVGKKRDAKEIVLKGLEALEYRGYDSAGITFLDEESKPHLVKQVGRVESLKEKLGSDTIPESYIAIGHTRWATHGSPTIANAHPHQNSDGTIFVVHNGIIENASELREKLETDGYEFFSQTDTEVIPHLIDKYFKETNDFERAFKKALGDLEGAYGIVALSTHTPNTLFAARLSSPLVIGIGEENGEYFLASDPSAILEYTNKVIYLEDYDLAVLNSAGHVIHNLNHTEKVDRESELLDYDAEATTLGDFPNFMLKEIYEAPQTIRFACLGRVKPEESTVKLGGLEQVANRLTNIERIVIVACGTSYYAGLVGEYLIEQLAGIPVEVEFASEFKYRDTPIERNTALLAISQSGETADTIAALKKVEDIGILRLGIVNAAGSTIARMTDAGVYCHAGVERAVASTKAFIAQVTVLLELALKLGKEPSEFFAPLLDEMNDLPQKAERVLKQAENIQTIAKKYTNFRDFLYIGRGLSYPCALEGALKLKEISYIHAEGYSAGEMKHGPLAMIDERFPTFAIATASPLLQKTLSNMEEIRARKGPIVAIATEGNTTVAKLADDVIYVPDTMEQTSPILIAIVLQLFSYFVATEKGLDIDRPRNLAKSVTVE